MSMGLPEGWVNATLKDIVLHKKGKKPSKTVTVNKNGYLPYVLIDEMEDKQVRAYTKDKNVPVADENDVLIVWDGSIGKTATGIKGVIGSTIAALTPIIVKANFLNAFLQLSKPVIEQTSRGTGLQHINPTTFWPLQFPLPPLNEQKRIAAKLDKIMPRIDALRERIDRIPQIIKRFRQSVLTAAVTGKLTEEWREGKNYQWENTNLGTLSEYITSGSRGWAKYYSSSGAIFVRAQNINTDKLELNDIAYVKLPKKVEGKRTQISKDDILITITGANVTKTAQVTINLEEAYVNQHVALVRLNNKNFASYLYLWLISPIAGRLQLEKFAYGAGKPGLNLHNIKDVVVMLPTLEEQKEIVRQVDQLFAFADKLEAHYNKAKEKIDKLPQSVLAKTFRGELVPQDPNDEPASELLKRIIVEKEKRRAEIKKTKKRNVKSTAQKKGK